MERDTGDKHKLSTKAWTKPVFAITTQLGETRTLTSRYHRGRFIEGQWVFGGICRETKGCFLVFVERRDTFWPIIRAQTLPGTRVISNLWKSFDCLQNEGYQHLTVN